MNQLIDKSALSVFKNKQDELNENKFMQINDYVDNDGKIKADKVQTETGIEVVKMHVDSRNPNSVKYFVDNNGVKGTTEIVGEAGKIYIDIASGGKIIYTYDETNAIFIPFISEIASTADIEELFNE